MGAWALVSGEYGVCASLVGGLHRAEGHLCESNR